MLGETYIFFLRGFYFLEELVNFGEAVFFMVEFSNIFDKRVE